MAKEIKKNKAFLVTIRVYGPSMRIVASKIGWKQLVAIEEEDGVDNDDEEREE